MNPNSPRQWTSSRRILSLHRRGGRFSLQSHLCIGGTCCRLYSICRRRAAIESSSRGPPPLNRSHAAIAYATQTSAAAASSTCCLDLATICKWKLVVLQDSTTSPPHASSTFQRDRCPPPSPSTLPWPELSSLHSSLDEGVAGLRRRRAIKVRAPRRMRCLLTSSGYEGLAGGLADCCRCEPCALAVDIRV